MSTPQRRYVVYGKDGMIAERMVMSATKAAAVAHVAVSMLEARLASPDDIERLVSMGIKTERPSNEPAATGEKQGDPL